MKNVLRALAHPNYRLYFGGQIVSLIGTSMQQTALSWLVYRLTGSTAMLGLVTFIGQIPSLLLAPIGGLLSDRFDRRLLLTCTQSLAAFQAAILAALTFAGDINSGILILMALALGLVNCVDQPVRQSFVPELVERKEDIPNAVALTSFTIHSARFLGPSIGGLLIASVGEGACFTLNALSYLGPVIALQAMQIRKAPRTIRPVPGALREGFVYVAKHREIRILLFVVATVAFFGSPYGTLLPYFAKEIYSGDARFYGVLATASGIGACLGTVFLASQKSAAAIHRAILIAMPVVSLALFMFATATQFYVAVISLAVMGFASINTVAASLAVIQQMVDDKMRGRVMSVYTMAFFGVTPVGALVTGFTARYAGARETLLGSACVILLVAASAAWSRRAMGGFAPPLQPEKR